ncbi:MAG: OsmC family protein [Pseudomonadota bacterium]
MDRDTQAQEGQHRAIAVFGKRPNHAQVTNTGTATVKDGLVCAFSDGTHATSVDMPEAIGGTGTAPSPGYFGRAAICSCIAIGVKMTAARDGLALNGVSVSIEQDFDNRGVLGMPGANAAPLKTRIEIAVNSPAPSQSVIDLVDRALQIDPWFLAFSQAQPVQWKCRTEPGAA